MTGCHRNDSSGASNTIWMFLGMFFTLLLLLPQTGQGGSQQEFGHEPGFVIITKLKVSLKKYEFGAVSPVRTYFFEGHGAYNTYNENGDVAKSGSVTVEEKVIWNSKSKRLTSSQKFKCLGHSTFTTETVYQCERMDPLLAPSLPKYKVLSCHSPPGSEVLLLEGEAIGGISKLRDGIAPGDRQNMVLKALVKSMRLEIAKTEVATPPGNAFLTLWYATDVPVPKNWTVQFFLEKENHQELKDYYGHKIDMPIIRKLQGNGVSFFRVDALPPGKYVAFVSANMATASRYDSQKVVFKVVKGERLNSTNPRASEVVKPTEGQITGSMPIFRILWDKRPNFNNNLILRIEYSKDASKYPYELLREERVPGNDWVYDEGARTYGKWVKLKDFDADYRVRVALDNQAYDMHRPQWGTWRHFKARLGRKFEIIEPKKAMQTYGYDTPDDIPIKIKLPSSMREKMTLVMTYFWMESTLDPVGTELFSYEDTIIPGQQMYKGAIGKGFLINEKFKKVGGGNPYHGFFRLYVRTKPDNPDMTGVRDFNIVGQEEQGADFSHAADLLPPIIIPLKLHYRTMEDVGIQMRHAGKVKPEFQLRFRPSANNSYTMLPHVTHRFTTSDDITTLHLKFRKPGQYQIRFRSGKGGRWGSWHGFEVVTSEVASLKTVKSMTQNRLKMPLAPPVIETPRERQAFMLMGREVLVSSRIRHAADAKVEMEIQHGTHGRFSPVRVKLDKRAGKTVSMFTMHLTKTGDYRFRVKLASVPNAPWGMWRTFRVDRLNQKPIYKMKPQSPKKNMTVPFNKINSNSSGIIGK